jgi:hypothetical protein
MVFFGRHNGKFFTLLFCAASIAAASGVHGQALYSIGNPSNEQQYMLELINRARANGGAEAARLGLSGLQEGPPTVNGESWTIENSVQPLSWNPLLANAAQGQANRLNNADQFFVGGSPHTFGGMTPSQRIAATGYSSAPYNGPTTPSGFFPGNENVSEEVSQGSGPYVGARLTSAVRNAHNGLFTDQTVPGRGHRETMMLGFFREIGVGISTGTDNQANPGQPNGSFDSIYIVQDYSTNSNQKPFITGVVYHDTNSNNFYDPGEGLGGVRVDVQGASFYAVTSASGGYSVPVAGDGTYHITFSGGGVASSQRTATVSGNRNVKIDYRTGTAMVSNVRGDFNGDTFTDYLLFNPSNKATAIWYLRGNALSGSAFGPALPPGWTVACVADLNRDHRPDYVLYNANTRQTAIWFLNNSTLSSMAAGPTLAAGWTLVAAADINGDMKPDYILFNANTRLTAIWFLNGTTLTTTAWGPTLPAGWTLVDVLDFNHDSKPDFLIANLSTRRTAIWYLDGSTYTTNASGPTIPSGWALRGGGDFNSDGKPDYVLSDTSTRRTAFWFLNGATLTSSAFGPTVPSGFNLVFP